MVYGSLILFEEPMGRSLLFSSFVENVLIVLLSMVFVECVELEVEGYSQLLPPSLWLRLLPKRLGVCGIFLVVPLVSASSLTFNEGILEGLTGEKHLELWFPNNGGSDQLVVGLRMVVFTLNSFVEAIREQVLVGCEVRFEGTFTQIY